MATAVEVGDKGARIRALGRNHELWSVLIRDLSLEGNRLPDGLKQSLIGLGLWSMRYSTVAILRDLPLAPLLEVNRNMIEGLAAQGGRDVGQTGGEAVPVAPPAAVAPRPGTPPIR